MSPRARQAKGKARLNAYEELLREESAQKIETAEIYIAPGPRLGDVVVEARKLRKGYGDNLLIEDLNFTLPRGGIVGVIGPNGAGKTTLFRMITGQEKPDAGTLKIGETVKIGYVDQSREALDAKKTVFEEITGGHDEIELGKRKVASRAYVSWFNFKGADATAEGGQPVRRRAQPRASRQAPEAGQQPAPARRADQRSRRRHPPRARRGAAELRRLRRRHQRTTAGSWTGSRPTCWRSRATARSSGSRGTIRTTRSTADAGLALRPTSRTASNTAS